MILTKFICMPKYELLIKMREDVGANHINDPNAFIECSNRMDVVYQYIDDHKSSIKRKSLIVFDGMTADIMSKKKFQTITKDLFIRCKKVNISLAFLTQSYFFVPKDVKLNSRDYLIIKINNRKELIILQILIITIF